MSVIVEVQVMQDLQHFARASDYFLGKSNDQIGSVVLNVLQAHLQDVYEELSLKCIEEGIYTCPPYLNLERLGFGRDGKLESQELEYNSSRREKEREPTKSPREIPSICHGEPEIRTRAATIGGRRISFSEALSLLHALPVN